MNPTLITALAVVGAIFLVVWVLVAVNNRDRKKDTSR